MALGYFYNMYRGKPLLKKGGVMILTHPCYDEFDHDPPPELHRVLQPPAARDARRDDSCEHKYQDEFANNPSYIEMYRRGNAYHGAHPFFMWYWGQNGRQHVGKVIVVGAENAHVPEDPGLGARRLARRGDRDGARAPSARRPDHDDAPPAHRDGGHGVALPAAAGMVTMTAS